MSRFSHSSNTLSISPAASRFRMPAEWEPHAATWLAWPHYHSDWPGKFEPIPWVYTEIVRNMARHERVELIVNNVAAEKQARKMLLRADAPVKNVRFHRWPTNRGWMRDSGCVFVTDQELGFAHSRDERERHDFSRAVKGEKKTRALTPGRNIPTGGTTKKSAASWRTLPQSKKSVHFTATLAWCSKAARSTSTAAARSSPPKNACSAKCSNAIPACLARTTKKSLLRISERRT